jgi:hypothetical protein
MIILKKKRNCLRELGLWGCQLPNLGPHITIVLGYPRLQDLWQPWSGLFCTVTEANQQIGIKDYRQVVDVS